MLGVRDRAVMVVAVAFERTVFQKSIAREIRDCQGRADHCSRHSRDDCGTSIIALARTDRRPGNFEGGDLRRKHDDGLVMAADMAVK